MDISAAQRVQSALSHGTFFVLFCHSPHRHILHLSSPFAIRLWLGSETSHYTYIAVAGVADEGERGDDDDMTMV